MCFLVAGKVYEIHLYQRMPCQGVDGRCVWSRGWFISSRKKKAHYSEVWMCWCVRLKEEGTERARERERESVLMCLFQTGLEILRVRGTSSLPRARAQTVSSRVSVEKKKKKGNFSLKHQYPHAELIKSTLARQETGNKTQHMEAVRLLWFRSSIRALQWI